ncbi:unnamed protein product, partial [Laminaria digitata]
QHTKRPGYDHFGGFFGRGVFTSDGAEWREKRASVAHSVFRGSGGRGLSVLANEEADSLLKEVEALWEDGDGGEVEMEIVRLLQRHTLNLVHRFLCGGVDVCSSAERRRLLPLYLDAVTDMRMVILARSRSIWMFAWGWAYRAFSPFHAQETRNMGPIRAFAELVLDASVGGKRVGVGAGVGVGARGGTGDGGVGEGGRGSSSSSSSDSSDKSDSDRKRKTYEGVRGGGGRGAGGKGRGPGKAAVGVAAAAAAGVGTGAKTALSEMAERESHRKHPDAMVDETITLLFAGQDTSAATLSWTMHLLSLPENRPYLLEVRRETLAAADPDGHIHCASAADKHLPMVDACIRESQRLYPVAPFVVRHLTSDLRLKDGTLLPAGALACVWIYGLHRHPALWKSPDSFVPERWLNGAQQ